MHQVVQGWQGADGAAALPAMAPATAGEHNGAGPAHRPGGQIVVVPAHGGAGASTLADWLRRELSTMPAGQGWRVGVTAALRDADPAQIAASAGLYVPPPAVPVIIAARGNVQGARRAVIAVTALEQRGTVPVAIAMVADGAGPEPRQVIQYLDLIGTRAGPVVRIPFVAALRAGALPGAVRMRRGLRAAVTGLLTLAVPEPARAGEHS
jgi:hypothetical protein